MLSEFDDIVGKATGAARETIDRDLRAAARALLDRQFVFSDDFQGRRRYETVRKHRPYFSSLFDALGFDLVVDEREQLAGIVSQSDALSRRMTLNETLFMLALRVVYEQRVREFMLGETGRADTTMAEVWGLVEERAKRQRPSPAKCRAIAEAFARNGILRLGEPLSDGDVNIEIRPVIARAVTVATAESLERYASSSADGDEEGAVPLDGDDMPELEPDETKPTETGLVETEA